MKSCLFPAAAFEAGWRAEEGTALSPFLCIGNGEATPVGDVCGVARYRGGAVQFAPQQNRSPTLREVRTRRMGTSTVVVLADTGPPAGASALLQEISRDVIASVGHEEKGFFALIHDHSIGIE